MIWFKKDKRALDTTANVCDLSCRAEAGLERIRAQMLSGAWRR